MPVVNMQLAQVCGTPEQLAHHHTNRPTHSLNYQSQPHLLKSKMTNWIHPAHVAVSIQKDLSRDSVNKEKMERIIELWQNADNSRNDPKALLTFFGNGLSVYITLPERLKESLWV